MPFWHIVNVVCSSVYQIKILFDEGIFWHFVFFMDGCHWAREGVLWFVCVCVCVVCVCVCVCVVCGVCGGGGGGGGGGSLVCHLFPPDEFAPLCTICSLFIEDAGQPPSSALQ